MTLMIWWVPINKFPDSPSSHYFLRLKNPSKNQKIKEYKDIRYKEYKNILSTLLKQKKQFYFTSFFQENSKDLKNTWKGIKNIIFKKLYPYHSHCCHR